MKMVKLFLTAAMAIVAPICGWAEGDADEPESPLSVDVSSAFLTDYMWRGFNLYDGVSIQPSVNAGYSFEDYGTLSANIWSQISAENDHKEGNFNEIDYTLRYDIDLGPATFTLGHIWYTFPYDNTGTDIPSTQEVLAGVSFGSVLLAPTLTVFEDYDEYDMQYYELSFSHEIVSDCLCLGEGFNMTPYAAFGFASSAEEVYADNGLEQVTIGATFALELGVFDVTPTLNYTFKVDDNTVNEFWSGFTLGYSF